MKKITIISLLILLALLACSKNSKAPIFTEKKVQVKKAPILLRFYIQAPENTKEDQTFTLINPGTKKEIRFLKNAILSEADIKNVSLRDGLISRYTILLEFFPNPSERLAQITGKNLNRYIAVLVDKKLLFMPLIRQKIVGGKAVIVSRASADEIKKIFQRLSKLLQLRNLSIP